MASRALTNRGLLRAALVIFALFLTYRFITTVAAVALLLATGLLLAVALSAPVEALYRRKVPRPVAVALIVVLALAALGLAGLFLYPILAKQASQLAASLPDAFSQIMDRARALANRFGINVGGGSNGVSAQTLARVARRVLGGLVGLFSGLTAFFTGLIVVLFVPLYLAALPGPVVNWVVRLFPPEKREHTREVLAESRTSLLQWLAGRLFSMAVVGLLSTAALYLIGVPGALLLGIFSGLVAFVPIIGSIVGAIPPLILAFAGNPLDALWVVLAYIAIQQIESNLLTPLVMQKAVSLHPVVVIVSVTVAGAAFGVLGSLLAVPVSVVAGVLIEELWFKRIENQGQGTDSGG
ncbi:MAG: AI-2E family transporter [Actinomycetota bacterium]|nr:AI-2E family transporter [Actinomycetota bacterium]